MTGRAASARRRYGVRMTSTGPLPQELIDGFAHSYAVACAFFTDGEGRALLVRANGRGHWQFVGGMVDRGEAPHEACAREIKEEIGFDVPIGDLLVLDYVPDHQFIPAPMSIYVFDGGVIDDPSSIRLQATELEEFGFFAPDRAASLFAEGHRERVGLALDALRTGRTIYQPFSRAIRPLSRASELARPRGRVDDRGAEPKAKRPRRVRGGTGRPARWRFFPESPCHWSV